MDYAELLDAAFRPLTGAALFRGNVFRLAGLAVTASDAEIRARRREVGDAVRLGLPPPRPAGPAPACGPEPTGAEVSAALEDLQRDPVRRFVHELLWVWGGSDALAAEHDSLVGEHCRLLAVEWPGPRPVARSAASDRYWSAVLGGWAALLDRAELWRRLEQRAVTYADLQVTPALVERLRGEIAGRLLAVNVDIAVHAALDDPAAADRHLAMLRELPFPHGVVDEAVRLRARAAQREVSRACAEASEQAGSDPDTGPARADALLAGVAEPLRVLAALLGPGEPTADAVCDEVAGTLSDICLGYFHHGTVDRRARAAAVRAQLQAARELARDPQVRELRVAELDALARSDADIEHHVRNGVRAPKRQRPDEVVEAVRVHRQERVDAGSVAEMEVREDPQRRGGEQAEQRRRAQAAPPPGPRRDAPVESGQGPLTGGEVLAVVGFVGLLLGLVTVVVAFVIGIPLDRRDLGIAIGAFGWGAAVACGIVLFGLSAWSTRPPGRQTVGVGLLIGVCTVLALLVPTACVALLLGPPPWGLAVLGAGAAALLTLLAVGFWDPWVSRNASDQGMDPAWALVVLAFVAALPMFGPGLVSTPDSYDDGHPRNGYLGLLGVVVLVCGLGIAALQRRRRQERESRQAPAARWWRAVGTVGWLGFGTALPLLAVEATQLTATFVLVTTPTLILLGHGLLAHALRQVTAPSGRRLALLIGGAVLLPVTLFSLAAWAERAGSGYLGAYGTETDVDPGLCIFTSVYSRYGLDSYTTCSHATWTVDGVRHVGVLHADGRLSYSPVRAFVLDDQAYPVREVGSISPTVVLGQWHHPLVLLALLPVQAWLLGAYLVPPILRWWRETPS